MKLPNYDSSQADAVQIVTDDLEDDISQLGSGGIRKWLLIWDNVDDLVMLDEALCPEETNTPGKSQSRKTL